MDIGRDADTPPRHRIIPDWWVRNDAYIARREYLARHGGKRARNPKSSYHAIRERRLGRWEGRWEILGLFGSRGKRQRLAVVALGGRRLAEEGREYLSFLNA